MKQASFLTRLQFSYGFAVVRALFSSQAAPKTSAVAANTPRLAAGNLRGVAGHAGSR